MEVLRDKFTTTIILTHEQHAKLYIALKDMLEEGKAHPFEENFIKNMVKSLNNPKFI